MANFLGHPEGRECIPNIPNDFLDAFTRYKKKISKIYSNKLIEIVFKVI